MEHNYNLKMQEIGYTDLVCDIFLDWENVKDEILLPDRKQGSGNGTVHVFLGAADEKLREEFHSYYFSVLHGRDNSVGATRVNHYFLKSNVLSMIGYLCQYYKSIDKPYDLILDEIMTELQLCPTENGMLKTYSQFKLSLGSNKLRPYFKNFDNKGVFHKIIRMLLLPKSAYKISLYKNSKGEYAAFWLIGFDSMNDFEVDSTTDYITNKNDDKIEEKKEVSLQQIFYGAPGTGKSHTINHTTAGEDVIRTTFHPDTDYSTFVGAYKPTTIEETVMTVIGTKAVPVENADGTPRKESKIVYEFVAQAFLQAYVEAWKKVAEAEGEPKKQFLVIEEINRGNCAQIFGDLFQLLDRNDSGFSDYPIQADADMKRQLQKAFNGMELTNKEALNSLYEGRNVAEEVINGDILLLPSNLYIWGTMNTSDQSLFPIDSAFKRRWDWTYMPISNAYKEWTIKVGNDNYDWWSFLESINDKIGSTTNSEDKKLGYFFCKAQNDVIPVEKFVGKVIFYLWNDVFKDYEFGDAIFNDEDGSKLTFAKFYTEEGRNARIVTDKVAVFLKNLGLEPSFIEPDAETNSVPNSESGSQMDYSKYSLNGEGSYSKGGLVYEAVKRYATAHAESTADEIVNTWLRLGINVPYLVETAEEHEQRKQQTSDSRFDQKSKMLELPNHEVIYISNQFNVQRIEDFIEKVNAQPWHLTLAKI